MSDLLDRLRAAVDPAEVDDLEPFIHGLQRALLAVIDAHPPRELTDEECIAWKVRRGTRLCVGDPHKNGLHGALHAVYWPCPTLRMIAVELGVDDE